MMSGDEYYYRYQQQQQQQAAGPGGFDWGGGFSIGGTPHGAIMAVVVGLAVGAPLFLGEGGEAVTAAVADALGPTGMLLLPVALVLVIRVLSSYPDHRGGPVAAIADALFRGAGGSPAAGRGGVAGSPVGVALALALIVLLLYYRSALLGGGGGDDDE